MKAGLLSIAALSAVAVAQPQHGAHRHRHAKKQAVEYVTDVTYVTAEPDVVYVDQNGNKVSGKAEPTTAPAAAASGPVDYSKIDYSGVDWDNVDYGFGNKGGNKDDSKPSSDSKNEASAPASSPAPSSAPAPSSYAAPSSSKAEQSAAPSSSSSSSSSSSGSSSDSGSNSGMGFSYSPYNADHSCKTKDQISQDLNAIDGYGSIRMYGVDCDQVAPIVSIAREKNWEVFAGVFDINSVEQEVETMSKALNGDWSNIKTVSVGNEGVNNGQYSVSDVKAAVEKARECLSESGYSGDVVTVDTFTAAINNPGLCDVGDYVAVNCHAFFDGGVTADKSGKFVLEQTQRVSEACGGKRVVITEAGWPSQGNTNGKAVPSKENQKAAVKDLKDNFSSDLYMFTAYNGYWKQSDADKFGIEAYWGIYGDCPSES